MKLIPTRIPGVLIVEPAVFGDDRGWFMESYSQQRFDDGVMALGLPVPRPFVQDNHSCSKAGVLRGLHLQLAPHAQGKLVRVTHGAVFDVAVDVRKGSATFGQWVGVELSAANKRQLWLPEGMAHGFLTLEDDTHFLYKTTSGYAKDSERAILWNDPDIGIEWPTLAVTPTLADKDLKAPRLRDADIY
ncbi:MAG: dTDP-4-dehydrorhamnose 3,5-epimerase [Aquabacterium sp.]|nr:dTDP-4-dehydrorhamnose 3,5-epimerase [Aquabacterium sp.]